jgi:hypothetical protein
MDSRPSATNAKESPSKPATFDQSQAQIDKDAYKRGLHASFCGTPQGMVIAFHG